MARNGFAAFLRTTTKIAKVEHFHFENALLTRKRHPPQRGVHSGENRVFRLNATFDFHKKSKVICSMEREGKRQARITAQRLRAEEREQRRLDREWEAQQRQEERQRMADLREQERLGRQQAKEAVQAFLKAGQDALPL